MELFQITENENFDPDPSIALKFKLEYFALSSTNLFD